MAMRLWREMCLHQLACSSSRDSCHAAVPYSSAATVQQCKLAQRSAAADEARKGLACSCFETHSHDHTRRSLPCLLVHSAAHSLALLTSSRYRSLSYHQLPSRTTSPHCSVVR